MVAHWVGYDANSTHMHRIYWLQKRSVSVKHNVKFTGDARTIPISIPHDITMGTTPAPPVPASITSTPLCPPPVPVPAPAQVTSPPPQPPPVTSSSEEEMDDEEVDLQLQATPAPRKGKAARALLATPATCHLVQLHEKQLARGEGSVDSSPAVPGSYGVDIALGKSTSVINAHSDIGLQEYALYAGLEDIMAAALHDAEGDPKLLQEAQSCADWPSWKAVMDHKMEMLEKVVTWKQVVCLPGKNVIGCKWVFRIKCKANGSIKKYKAWLVTCGFMQIHGVDYFETYSPVAKLASFRLILTIKAHNGWEVHAFDFNGAYLNGKLEGDKEIYMQQPLGYETRSAEWVMELLKALYGLKQAGRRWYDVLLHALKELGFTVSAADPGVFYTRLGTELLILAIHVNNCTMTGSCVKLILEYKAKLNSC